MISIELRFRGSVESQPARQVHDDKCGKGGRLHSPSGHERQTRLLPCQGLVTVIPVRQL
jgi:hypothetical protein